MEWMQLCIVTVADASFAVVTSTFHQVFFSCCSCCFWQQQWIVIIHTVGAHTAKFGVRRSWWWLQDTREHLSRNAPTHDRASGHNASRQNAWEHATSGFIMPWWQQSWSDALAAFSTNQVASPLVRTPRQTSWHHGRLHWNTGMVGNAWTDCHHASQGATHMWAWNSSKPVTCHLLLCSIQRPDDQSLLIALHQWNMDGRRAVLWLSVSILTGIRFTSADIMCEPEKDKK